MSPDAHWCVRQVLFRVRRACIWQAKMDHQSRRWPDNGLYLCLAPPYPPTEWAGQLVNGAKNYRGRLGCCIKCGKRGESDNGFRIHIGVKIISRLEKKNFNFMKHSLQSWLYVIVFLKRAYCLAFTIMWHTASKSRLTLGVYSQN